MKALIIHRDMMPALLTMRDADLGSLMRSAISLVSDERDEPPPAAELNFAWTFMRTKILEHGKKYDEECQRRSDKAREAAWARHHPDGSPRPRHAQASPRMREPARASR